MLHKLNFPDENYKVIVIGCDKWMIKKKTWAKPLADLNPIDLYWTGSGHAKHLSY